VLSEMIGVVSYRFRSPLQLCYLNWLVLL